MDKNNRLVQYERAVARYLEAYHNYHDNDNATEQDAIELNVAFEKLCELDSSN